MKMFLQIAYAPYITFLEMQEREKSTVLHKSASGTSDVSYRREIVQSINSSSVVLTSKVPKPFSISLKISYAIPNTEGIPSFTGSAQPFLL